MSRQQVIRAAVCRGFGEALCIEEVHLAPPGPGQIGVRLAACAICHSDVAYAEGIWGGTLPAIYGHEAAGVVEAVGAGVTGWAVGDRALVTLIRACGSCPACTGGQPTTCHHTYDAPPPSPLTDASGAAIFQGLQSAAFAEAVVVAATQCAKLPDDLPMEQAALIACGVITGVGAVVNTAQVRPGQSVVVIGAGGVGLNTIQGAALSGASPIIAIDINPAKLEAALEFGATHGIPAGEDAARAVRANTGGLGADHVLVTVGAAAVYSAAPDYLAPGGTLTMVGMTASGATATYEPANIAALNQTLKGSRMGQTVLARDIPWLIEAWRAGRLKLDALISGRYPLARINEAIADLKGGAARRNVIIFGDQP